MLTSRPVDLERDRELLFELHTLANYESDTPHERAAGFDAYRERWLASGQPRIYLDALRGALAEDRAVAEVWERDGVPIGYFWITFSAIPTYAARLAEIDDIAILREHQRQGIGTQMIQAIEQIARERGVTHLRSSTGSENVASRRLHANAGLEVIRVEFEKLL